MYEWKPWKHAGSRESLYNCCTSGQWMRGKSITSRSVVTFHSSHAAASLLYSHALCCHSEMKEIEQFAAVPGGSHHADCRRQSHYVTVFHVAGRLPVEDLQLCANWHGRWAVQLIEWSDYYMGGFRKTVPRKTAENTVKYHGGSVGSVIASHRGSGENSVTITRLLMTSSNYSIAHCSSCRKICLCIQCILHFAL